MTYQSSSMGRGVHVSVYSLSTRLISWAGTLLFARAWDAPVPGLAVTEIDVRAPGLEWSAEDVRTAVADFMVRLEEEAGRAGVRADG